jgi:hypothetical protein
MGSDFNQKSASLNVDQVGAPNLQAGVVNFTTQGYESTSDFKTGSLRTSISSR